MRYAFGDVVLDTDRFELRRGGEPVHVEPQVFSVLMLLVERRHRVVHKTELLDEVWGDRFVSESALTSRIKAARQAVGDDGTAQQVIRTAHGRGYQLIAEVTEEAGEPALSSLPDPPSLDQEIRFCTTKDGHRLAYATIGEGPPLVRAAHWITHLDYDWHSPVWRHWLEGLARSGRSSATTSAGAASRTTTSTSGLSTRSSTTWSGSSMPSTSIGSRSWACRRAARWP